MQLPRSPTRSDSAENHEPLTERPVTTEEQLSRCVLHATRPMENLPVLRAHELASIGRCATLSTDTTIGSEMDTLMYEGMITYVTADCITMVHCSRFTKEEYLTYRQQVDPDDARHAVEVDAFHNLEGTRSPSGDIVQRTSTSPEFSAEHPLTAPTQLPVGDCRRVREKCTMGPLPMVTFYRKKIHNVHFSINPPSTFYSLFQDPSKRFFDMQCLRMFVRRYVVHTSQGNNPTGIPLKAFVECRANCRDVDEALLERVAKEELGEMLKIDAKIVAEQSERRQRGRGDLQMFDGVSAFRLALESTGVPRFTTGVAVLTGCLAAFILGFAVLFIYGIGMSPLVCAYVNMYWQYIFIGAFLGVPVTLVSSYHASLMAPPLSSQFYYSVARVVITSCTLVVAVISVVRLINAGKKSTFEYYFRNSASEADKCSFYHAFQCSGFSVADVTFAVEKCRFELLNSPFLFAPCKPIIMMKLNTVIYPLMVSYILFSVFLLMDLSLLFAMMYYIRKIDRNSARW